MKVKLGCMTRPYAKYPVERALEGIAGAGFKYTAFLGNHPDGGAYNENTPVEIPMRLKEKMAGFGLKPVTAWGSNPLTYGIEGMKKHVHIAGELELEYLILSSPYVGKNVENPPSAEEIKKRFLTIIEAVLPLCEQYQLRLDIKPHMGPYGRGPGMAELAATINHPLFGVSYDPGNIHFYEGLSPKTDLPAVASRVTSICVKDHKGPQLNRDFPNPGDGDIDWPDLFRQLKAADFTGYALIEVMNGASPEEIDAAASRTRRRLISWITEAQGQVVE
ncbi:MAG TPA: sugar phosphate isomerase/epimerase [Firmicutes bacterium]|nr:sugar phosphate isomerase/epimerase [Bacillota bacterium]